MYLQIFDAVVNIIRDVVQVIALRAEAVALQANAVALNSPRPDFQEPRLETARLWLRPMQAADFDALWLIFTDPKVMAAFDSTPFTLCQPSSRNALTPLTPLTPEP